MPALVTSKFRIQNAKQFVERLNGPESGGSTAYDGVSYIYLFIAKVIPWDETHLGFSDSFAPSPEGTVQSNYYEPWRNMLALTRVANTDVSMAARRYDWTTGTVYTQYDDRNSEVAKGLAKYFVYVPSSGNVFKCLDNNNGTASTETPTKPLAGVLTESFTTSDGYRWKYMLTIPAGTAAKFLTDNYIPVRTVNLLSTPTPAGFEDQKIVQESANSGTIDSYVLIAPGAGYTAHSGAVSLSTLTDTAYTPNTTVFQLSDDPALTALGDDHFNGASIMVSNTSGIKGVRSIVDYGELTITGVGDELRSVKVDPPFETEHLPEVGDSYIIGPTVLVEGDGQNANAYSECSSSGSVLRVAAARVGNSYSFANVTIVQPNNLAGSGASARAIIPPNGGHGFDPVTELNAFNVIITKSLTGAGIGNTFPIDNDYRVVGLVRNAILANGYNSEVDTPATSGANWFANTDPLRQSTWIVTNTTSLSSGTWTPAPDEEVQGETSGAKGRIVEFNTDGRGILSLTNIVANTLGLGFMSTERIGRIQDAQGISSDPLTTYVTANGASLGFVADPDFPVVQGPEVQPYTGDILYLENRTPISRSAEQAEDISIVVEF